MSLLLGVYYFVIVLITLTVLYTIYSLFLSDDESSIVETPPVETPPIQTPPIQTPPVETPTIQTPPVETPTIQPPPVKPPTIQIPPVQPVPIQPPPIQPVPIQHPPIQPVPIQPVPIQPAPIQPVPIQPAPIQPVPIQPPPIQPPPIQPPPIQPPPFVEILPDQIPPVEIPPSWVPPIGTPPMWVPPLRAPPPLPIVSDANIILWMDGSDQSTITLDSNGIGITNWKDKSSNKYDFFQSTVSAKPSYIRDGKNGKSLIRFTKEKSQYLGGGTSLPIGTNNLSMFLLFKINGIGNGNRNAIFNKSLYGTAPNRILALRDNTKFLSGMVGKSYTEFTNDNISYQLLEVIMDRQSGKSYNYINGTLITTGSFAPDIVSNIDNNYNMIIGGYNDSKGNITRPHPYYYLGGDICEILLYTHSKPLSESNRLQIESYLKNKWAV